MGQWGWPLWARNTACEAPGSWKAVSASRGIYVQALQTHVAKTAFRFLPLESKRKQVPGEKDLSAEWDCSWDHCNHIGYGTESVSSGQDVTAAHPLIHRPSNLNEACVGTWQHVKTQHICYFPWGTEIFFPSNRRGSCTCFNGYFLKSLQHVEILVTQLGFFTRNWFSVFLSDLGRKWKWPPCPHRTWILVQEIGFNTKSNNVIGIMVTTK